jgi:hypothetical protein
MTDDQDPGQGQQEAPDPGGAFDPGRDPGQGRDPVEDLAEADWTNWRAVAAVLEPAPLERLRPVELPGHGPRAPREEAPGDDPDPAGR